MKFNFQNAVKKLFDSPLLLARHTIIFFLFITFIVLGAGFLVFNSYVVSIRNMSPDMSEDIDLNEKIYNSVLNRISEEEGKFNEADSKQYLNPFARTILANGGASPEKK